MKIYFNQQGIRFTIHGKTLKIRSAMFQPKKKGLLLCPLVLEYFVMAQRKNNNIFNKIDSSDGNNFNYLEGNRVIPTYHQGTTYYKDLPAEYKVDKK